MEPKMEPKTDQKTEQNVLLAPEEFTRLVNNFYVSRGLDQQISRVNIDAELFNHVLGNLEQVKQKSKVAFCCICVNPHYWEFIKPLIEGARNYFLPGHKTDFFLWSDIPKTFDFELIEKQIFGYHTQLPRGIPVEEIQAQVKVATQRAYESVQLAQTINVFGIEAEVWPMPTLMRYHLMLQQEEKLQEYDYIFYCDIDMLFASIVGDEILGKRLTAVQQPMYALRKEFWPPYEPNPKSASYIPRPGKIINDNGQPRFAPLYFAGGFQGGKADKFIEAMKVMKKKIDEDFNKNYIPIWNDETVWNSYLFENPADEDLVLTPSYTYPDSLQKEYFIPMWGKDYYPKLVTLTKKFNLTTAISDSLKAIINSAPK